MTKTKSLELFGLEWTEQLFEELSSESFNTLSAKLQLDRLNNIKICPNKEDIFKAFRLTNLPDVKTLLLGQDCYHSTYHDQSPIATGLAFGVKNRSYIPPSLKNIHKELESDLNVPIIDFDYSLESWAKQGVLLLNTALTVQENRPLSHAKYWNSFTQKVLETINKKCNNIVVIMWGSSAKSFKKYLTNESFRFVESSHPSPLSDGQFIGSKPFSKTNQYLKELGKEEINWLKYVEN